MNDCTSCFRRPNRDESAPSGNQLTGKTSWQLFCGLQATLLSIAVISLAATALRAEQPIAYSHKIHIEHGLQCLDCHSGADTGARATIPSVSKCMLCHAKIATDKTEVKRVAEFAAARREIPWERVYGFDPGALVNFQHAPHIRAGVQCARCHGDMTQAATAQPLVKHNMGTCLSCHRQNHASEDCATCHY
jgi:Cytochrome c7 and related cytochrome c